MSISDMTRKDTTLTLGDVDIVAIGDAPSGGLGHARQRGEIIEFANLRQTNSSSRSLGARLVSERQLATGLALTIQLDVAVLVVLHLGHRRGRRRSAEE